MEFTVILNILLFIGCYRLFGNWEIPVELGFDPFEVVGGFPTLIDSYFDDFFAKNGENAKNAHFETEALPDPIYSSRFTRKLAWKCPILEGQNQCFTVVTTSECLATSQLSYSFWEDSMDGSECFYRSNSDTECRLPFQRGNLCENVVMGIQKIGNSTVFELDNVMINTQIVQNYAETPGKVEMFGNTTQFSSSCQNYSSHEMLLAAGENNSDIFSLFPFGINRTQLPQTTDCSPPFPTDTFLCNCRNDPTCNIPIIYLTTNSSFCGSTTISIYHTNGFIYSVIVTSSEDTLLPSVSQKHSVVFFDLPQAPPLSRFDLQRGRFHCPSETTCILEVFYPFSFLNSLEIPYQIGILIVSLLLAIVFLYGRN